MVVLLDVLRSIHSMQENFANCLRTELPCIQLLMCECHSTVTLTRDVEFPSDHCLSRVQQPTPPSCTKGARPATQPSHISLRTLLLSSCSHFITQGAVNNQPWFSCARLHRRLWDRWGTTCEGTIHPCPWPCNLCGGSSSSCVTMSTTATATARSANTPGWGGGTKPCHNGRVSRRAALWRPRHSGVHV